EAQAHNAFVRFHSYVPSRPGLPLVADEPAARSQHPLRTRPAGAYHPATATLGRLRGDAQPSIWLRTCGWQLRGPVPQMTFAGPAHGAATMRQLGMSGLGQTRTLEEGTMSASTSS